MKLVNRAGREAYERLISDAATRVGTRLTKVHAPARTASPHELRVRASSVDLDSEPIGPDATLEELDELFLSNAVWFHTPGYLAHLNCPVEVTSVAAETILAAVNTSVDTYDQSRIGTFIEHKVIEWASKRVGFGSGDGIFTSGGTQSNLHALLLAREDALKHTSGATRSHLQQQLVLFANEEGHFSVAKAARILGLSDDAVVHVPGDETGRMSPELLRSRIADARSQGRTPFAVVATAGTTDRGVIDPIEEIAEVARLENLWFHVDAAYGGGLLTSRTHRQLLKGIELARSVTVDFHKMFFQPISSSALLLQKGSDFGGLQWHADYLNPEDSDEPNQVDKSLQTTRRFDALKLFATLRSVGVEGLGRAVDQLLQLTQQVHAAVEADPDFALLSNTDLTTVLFRWEPAGLTAVEADSLVAEIRSILQREGTILLAKTRIENRPALKFTLLNPELTLSDVLSALEQVRAIASDLYTTRHGLQQQGSERESESNKHKLPV